MRILGIDPGLNATGYGVIAVDGSRLQLVAAGTIRPPARGALSRRLLVLYDALAKTIDAHQPTIAVLEAIYTHHQYLTTAAMMAHARGVACLVSAQRGLEVIDYLPTRVKKALTGHGAASKQQVSRMVGQRLGTHETSWSADATDALALAITHAAHSRAVAVRCDEDRRTSRAELLAVIGAKG